MTKEEIAIYKKIIAQIEFKIDKAKTDLVNHIPGDMNATKGLDPNFIMCRNMFYWQGYIGGLDDLSRCLSMDIEQPKVAAISSLDDYFKDLKDSK